MHLEGSCHCGAVRFSVESQAPYPFMRCYCTVCRKTSGGGGFLVNVSAKAKTLEVEGREQVKVYRAMLDEGGRRLQSEHERHFCARCGSHLWAFHPGWPDLVHPVAAAIDTPLPQPKEHLHMMLASCAPWVEVEGKKGDMKFAEFPDVSIAEWHRARGLYEE